MTEQEQLLCGYLPTADGTLAATVRMPGSGSARGVVVLVPPLFEERKACASAMRSLAERLAEAGLATLRVDVSGTGDSPGALGDALVETWESDLDAAATFAEQSGLPVVWAGIRLGALLALRGHGRRPGAALLLWEPLMSGAAALHQAVQRKLVNEASARGRAGSSRASLDEVWEQGGGVDLDGHWVSAGLRRGLLALDPARPPVGAPALLLLHRAGSREAGLRDLLGPSLEICVEPAPPFWNLMGIADVEAPARRMADWLAGTLQPNATGDAASLAPPQQRRHGEQPVAIRLADGWLRGIRHAPADGRERLRVLLLAGWTGCRLGPHGLLTELARSLAQAGIGSLRIDFRGRGDSSGDPARASIASMAEDADAALGWLRQELPPATPLAALGICSGAKVALISAARSGDVPLVCCWSPDPLGSLRPTTLTRARRSAILRTYAHKLLQRETWRKLLRGRLQVRLIGRALGAGAGADAGAPERDIEEEALRQLPRRQVELCLIGGSEDPGADAVEAAYAAYCARSGITCLRQRIDGAGHGFYGTAWSEELIARTRTWLAGHAGRLD